MKLLAWHHEEDGRVIGVAGDGLVYAVEKGKNGGCRWVQGKKRGVWCPGGAETAKVDAERVERQRLATQKVTPKGRKP